MVKRTVVELVPAEPDNNTYVELADVLVDCVADGASVGFLEMTNADAQTWWRGYLADRHVLTWVARDELSGRIIGTVGLDLPDKPNALRRAEVVKLMVHRDARAQRCATALLEGVEGEAHELGRTLLLLDRGELAPTAFMSKTLR